MIPRIGRSKAATEAVLASGLGTLVGGISLIFAASLGMQKLHSSPAVAINVDAWSWAEKVSLGSQTLQVAQPSAAEPVIKDLPVRKLAVASPVRPIKKLTRAKTGHSLVAKAKASQPKSDRIVTRMSAVTTAAAAQPELGEHEKLQLLHRNLRARFVVAVNDYYRAPVQYAELGDVVNTQLTGLSEAAPVMTTQAPKAPKSRWRPVSRKKAAKAYSASPASVNGAVAAVPSNLDDRDIDSRIQKVILSHEKRVSGKSAQDDASKQIRISDTVSAGASSPMRVVSGSDDSTTVDAYGPPVSDAAVQEMRGTPSESPVRAESARAYDASQSRRNSLNTQSDEAAVNIHSEKAAEAGGQSNPSPSVFNGYSVATTQVNAQVNTQRTASIPPAVRRPKDGQAGTSGREQSPASPGAGDDSKGAGTYGVLGSSSRDSAASAESASSSTYMMAAAVQSNECIEAFNWSLEVPFCDRRTLSQENANILGLVNGPDMGWMISQAKDHWPTLWWKGAAKDHSIPLLSNNAALMLGKLAEVNIHSEAGIVFGTVAPGWTVTISGRADAPLFLNSRNELLAGNATAGERHFAILNAEPGASIIYLRKPSTGEVASVAVPVFNGFALYVDLRSVTYKTASGWVLDSAARAAKGLSGVQVSVIDQPVSAVTNKTGAFLIEKVAVVGDMPVYLETHLKDQDPHRYRLSANALASVPLYRFDKKTVDGWVAQIEGGVSSESALVVAAVPQVVAKAQSESHLSASIRNVLESQPLLPETYTLSPGGELQVQPQLRSEVSRFLGLQVPGGPVIAGVKSQATGIVWSELLLTSPRVISVVGPY